MILKKMRTPNNSVAYPRLSWAHELYQRYSKMEHVSLQKEFDELNQLLDALSKAKETIKKDLQSK